MKKYGIEIAFGSVEYTPRVGWDILHDDRRDAERLAARAADRLGSPTRVFAIDAPEHVDHLYRCITDVDATSLYV